MRIGSPSSSARLHVAGRKRKRSSCLPKFVNCVRELLHFVCIASGASWSYHELGMVLNDTRSTTMRKTVIAALLLAAVPAAALAMDDHMAIQANALKWGPAPPGLPPGAQVAVVTGDPSKDGPYVVRAKLPAGYRIMPHTHPTDENVTVLSGTFHIGMGGR